MPQMREKRIKLVSFLVGRIHLVMSFLLVLRSIPRNQDKWWYIEIGRCVRLSRCSGTAGGHPTEQSVHHILMMWLIVLLLMNIRIASRR